MPASVYEQISSTTWMEVHVLLQQWWSTGYPNTVWAKVCRGLLAVLYGLVSTLNRHGDARDSLPMSVVIVPGGGAKPDYALALMCVLAALSRGLAGLGGTGSGDGVQCSEAIVRQLLPEELITGTVVSTVHLFLGTLAYVTPLSDIALDVEVGALLQVLQVLQPKEDDDDDDPSDADDADSADAADAADAAVAPSPVPAWMPWIECVMGCRMGAVQPAASAAPAFGTCLFFFDMHYALCIVNFAPSLSAAQRTCGPVLELCIEARDTSCCIAL